MKIERGPVESGTCPKCKGRGYVTRYGHSAQGMAPARPDGLVICSLCKGVKTVPVELHRNPPPKHPSGEPPNQAIGGGGGDEKERWLVFLWVLSCVGWGLIGYALGAL